jgi:hypothetical protein
MSITKHGRPFSEETPPHGDDDEVLEGLRDEERSDHYSAREDDWRNRRRAGAGYPLREPLERSR